MSKFQGGMIGSVANTPSGTNYTGKANGIWSLPHHIAAKSALQWAIGQTKPNPPTIGTATVASDTSASVAFIPPVQDGGATITIYTVTSSSGQTATGTSSPIIVTGLSIGTLYTFTVTATNSLGTSVTSSASNSVRTGNLDPFYASVSLLVSGDGTAGSTTFVDTSNNPKTITTTGSAAISTSVTKMGTGSMQFNTSGSYISLTDDSALGSNNFTIEFWIYPTAYFGGAFSVGATANTDYAGITFANGGTIYISYTGASWAHSAISCGSVPTNTWTHMAFTRYGNAFRTFNNGVLQSTTTLSGGLAYKSGLTFIGAKSDALPSGFPGYIDDFRVTVGIARYTGDFTVPTSKFNTITANTIYVGNGVNGGGTASSNSAPDPNRSAAAAFDGLTDNSYNCWHSGQDAFSRYLRYDLGVQKIVTEYWLMPRPSGDYFPSSWDFQGSNDGTSWTTLDSRSGVTAVSGVVAGSTSTQKTKFRMFNLLNGTSYRYYQWLLPSGSYIVIGEAVLLGS